MNFFKVTFLSGLLTLLRLICGFIISKIVAMYTGPSGVAALGQLQSFVALINGFVSSQVSQGVTRYTAENNTDYFSAAKYWRAALRLSCIAGCLIITIGILFSSRISTFLFLNHDYYWIIILALSVVPLNICNSIILAVLNGTSNYKKYFLANSISVFLFLISMLLFVLALGKTGALISAALNNAIAGLYSLFIIKNEPWLKIEYWLGPIDKDAYRNIRNYFYMGIIGALTGPISIIMVRNIISSYLSVDDAGYWQATLRISEAYLAVLTTAMTVYYFPKTAIAKTKIEHLIILKKGITLIVPMAITLSASIYFLREFILSILFTNEFKVAQSLFLYQNIGDFLRIVSWLFATILLAKGYFKLNAILEITFSLLFPTLTYIFIDKYGFITPSLAYLVNYIIYLTLVAFIYIWHIRRLPQ